MSVDGLALLGRIAAEQSAMIDASYPATLSDEAHLWRRCGKITEENGEAFEALLGLIGENPRKGVTATRDDLIRELLDVAFAALGAVEYCTGNDGRSASLLITHAERVRDRLAKAITDAKGCRPEDYHHLGPWESVPPFSDVERCTACGTEIGK